MNRRSGRPAGGWIPWAMALLLAAFASDLPAQTTGTAELRGRITDETGEGMPGVVVSLTNSTVALGARTAVTDVEGRYSFRVLPAGREYFLKATVPDYATVIAGPLELHANRTTELPLTLKPSSELEETIHVQAEGGLADLSRPAASTTFNSEFIEGVPLVGRNFADLLTLAPGVTDTDGDGNLNVRGARDTGLQLRIDGTNVTNPLTGHFGQQVNLESIEEVEVITGGASAEYGRADGGFANAITRSGGNDTEGSFKAFFRSNFLDGDGANADNNEAQSFTDTDLYATLGGAMVRDHLWYFATAERLDREIPTILVDGTSRLVTQEGWITFGKLTWQSTPDHKLSLQINYDPITRGGNNIGERISPESDYDVRTGGSLPQFTWTAILSPVLLLQVVASHLNGHYAVDPVSGGFRIIEMNKRIEANGQTTFQSPCLSRNCTQERNLRVFYKPASGGRGGAGAFDPLTGERGPYSHDSDQGVDRSTLRSDLSYTVEDRLGQHTIKGGFEFNYESYDETFINSPIVTNRTCSFDRCSTGGSSPVNPTDRQGTISIEIFEPVVDDLSAESFNAGSYLQDSWKPVPGLAINAGVRFDQESIESQGYTDFDPVREARQVLRIFDLWCDAAGTVCTNSRVPGRPVGALPASFSPPPGHPALDYDLNGDGVLETFGPEGEQVNAPYTTRRERIPEPFVVQNENFSPRLSVSWDPWHDGKTRFFSTWGTYYDRLFLQTVASEQGPQSITATWTALFNGSQIDQGDSSEPGPDAYNVPSTSRDLATPYTTEFTLGIERELAPEWTVSLTHVRRRGRDLIQDLDVNHITCKGFDSALNVDPMDVCGDSGGVLEMDRFGRIARTGPPPFGRVSKAPNGAIDLYTMNPNFNQVLRVGNFNKSEYTSTELTLRKRLHRNWQMLFSYTWSEAKGDAESFVDENGNDPAASSDKVRGYLDYDQRHVVKWQAVTHLPHDLLLGGTVEWSSGLPYSLVGNTEDFDETGNLTAQRIYSVTGLKNDQRNESLLTINGRIEKQLVLGKANVSAFLLVENLLDSDDLTYRQIDVGGNTVDQMTQVEADELSIGQDRRRFGRQWQIGASVFF